VYLFKVIREALPGGDGDVDLIIELTIHQKIESFDFIKLQLGIEESLNKS